ncbi:MAG TPA: adenylate/guanylate cyclase domain-containing protein [Stellaceae bacterium]|nr:adenylate/guanylate cyclase domain-containing protein [Stellaceae bacterium]
MAGERMERRLAAILAADVAGYSRLVGLDEEGTLAALRGLRRELIDPAIAGHRGRIVKTTGDGLLAEFASVVDALRCAAAMQAEIAERTAGVAVDRRLQLRIGIHQGDIVAEDGDIFGDGVNVAARLEALAEPGGICVSARVQEDALGRLDLAFEDLGEQALKNIARPVRAYRVALTRPQPSAAPSPAVRERGDQARSPWWVRAPRPSRCPTSHRSPSCRSRTCRATPSRNISSTAWSRRSSPRSAASAGSSSSPAIRPSPTKAAPSM